VFDPAVPPEFEDPAVPPEFDELVVWPPPEPLLELLDSAVPPTLTALLIPLEPAAPPVSGGGIMQTP
jgi:hypothetical protein